MTGTRPPCEKCQTPGIHLPGISSDSFVDYFRCAACAHVWTLPKEAPIPIGSRKPSGEPT